MNSTVSSNGNVGCLAAIVALFVSCVTPILIALFASDAIAPVLAKILEERFVISQSASVERPDQEQQQGIVGLEEGTVASNQQAVDDLLILVSVRANSSSSRTAAFGFVDGNQLVGTIAHDLAIPNADSISEGSFTLPVPRGSSWRIETSNRDLTSVWIMKTSREISAREN